jgi:toxin ParE1/3/4
LYVAKESGSIETADFLIDAITERFFLLTQHAYAGRDRNDDIGSGMRSFPVGEYVIVYCVEDADVLILRVVHGHRDLTALFS